MDPECSLFVEAGAAETELKKPGWLQKVAKEGG